MNDNNFFSVDRLLEFGMGMTMARQMVDVMNQSMQQMHVPGSMATMPQPQSTTLYVAIDGQPVGPLSEHEFANLVSTQRVTKDTLVWQPGMMGWKPLEQVPAFLRIIALTPPPIPSTL